MIRKKHSVRGSKLEALNLVLALRNHKTLKPISLPWRTHYRHPLKKPTCLTFPGIFLLFSWVFVGFPCSSTGFRVFQSSVCLCFTAFREQSIRGLRMMMCIVEIKLFWEQSIHGPTWWRLDVNPWNHQRLFQKRLDVEGLNLCSAVPRLPRTIDFTQQKKKKRRAKFKITTKSLKSELGAVACNLKL